MRAATIPWEALAGEPLLPRRHLGAIAIATANADAIAVAELCEVSSGIYSEAYVAPEAEGAIPYLRVNNVRALVPNLTPGDLVHVRFQPEWGERARARVGDVVIARTGTLGRAFVVPACLDGAVLSHHVTRLRLRAPDPERALLIAAYLNTREGKAQVAALASGSTRPEITHADVDRLRIPARLLAASMPEGTASSIDADLVAALAGAAAAFDAIGGLVRPPAGGSERVFTAPYDREALVRALTPRYHRPSQVALEARLRERYACEPLGRFALIRRGAGSRAAEYEDEGLPYARTSAIINHGLELYPEYRGSEATYRAHGQGAGPGDLLLTIEGKIGGVALLGEGERCLVKNHVEIIRLHEGAPAPVELVYALLASHLGQAQLGRRIVVQSTIPGIGSASRRLLVPVAGRGWRTRAAFRAASEAAIAAVRSGQAARDRLRRRLDAIIAVARAALDDDS
ncbi:MAG: hypothetical protein H6710_07610 [Myxococcales bacterium]|nr:hypothetical protein [Myxococcales bacterium]